MGWVCPDDRRHDHAGGAYVGRARFSELVRQAERLPYTGSSMKAKPLIYSAVNVIGALWVYRYLITGGWLTKHYQLNDPNIVNLVLAIFEPIAIVGVIAYWIFRTRSLYRLLSILFLAQLIVGAGFLVFILLFFITWKPKMM
jgi:hypothetical protein